MKLLSPDFEDRKHMPERVGYTRKNVNPVLKIQNIPQRADSLILLMDDPDAKEPAGKIWDHWTVWNIDPKTEIIGEGDSPGVEGMTDFGNRGYGGPNPPDGTHKYRFRLYALDTELDLPDSATKEDVLEEMDGDVIEEAKLEGKYDPV